MNECGLAQVDEPCLLEFSPVDLKFEKREEVVGAKGERVSGDLNYSQSSWASS